jgi:transcriptional regulator with AAA-type ATPase domain
MAPESRGPEPPAPPGGFPRWRSASAEPRGASSAAQFVGRIKEMDALRARLERAVAGHGGVALVVGEPGIGKTRIALELATRLPLEFEL